MPALQTRKQRGDYPTPPWLVDQVVGRTLPDVVPGESVRVLDPACGDGRFLAVAADLLTAAGARPSLVGIDVDAATIEAAAVTLQGFGDVDLIVGDALTMSGFDAADVVVGNPPFLSQLAEATTRGGSSRHGGGPYADVAAEFLAVAVRSVRPGGRVGLVLPQSILASRDAASVRADVDRLAAMTWSWWSPRKVFDADVFVCALGFERRRGSAVASASIPRPWSSVVTDALGVPSIPPLSFNGSLGGRARVTANFRDQYYALVPAVGDHATGPPLVTSGLIDPGCCRWGSRAVTFARGRYTAPRVELGALGPRMQRWAADLLVPKVLVANQTRVIEAVADPAGVWVPAVPVLTARPTAGNDVWTIAAVLTAPVAAAWAWHRAAGTGLSARTLRLGPRWLAQLPWPAGEVRTAVAALHDGDIQACGRAVMAAYGLDALDARTAALHDWWLLQLPA